MNCRNHPETPATVYCQYCGKPLCEACARRVENVVSCEPCLRARLGETPFRPVAEEMHVPDGEGSRSSDAYGNPPASYAPQWGGVPPHVSPGLALVLGFIPGVGAMYNGQFAKGLAHVVIFALLVDLAHYNGLLGLMVTAWIFYQVFDAYQTAAARRDGLRLPNPLGLNHVGQWFGVRSHPEVLPGSAAVPGAASRTTAGAPVDGASSVPLAPSAPPGWCGPEHARSGGGVPTGAIVLIGLGAVFLLQNLGLLREDWIDRGWPILLIALGVWMALRHSGRGRPGPPKQQPPTGGVR